MHPFRSSLYCLLSLIVGGSALLYSASAQAAEQVVLKYSVLRESVSVPELTTFAETGEASPALQSLFRTARQDPQKVRDVLTRPVKVKAQVLDRALNNPLGEVVLDRVGEAIHTPSDSANRQALRSALVLSSTDDGTLSLIEVLQKYPTSEVQVEGEKLVKAYSQIDKLAGNIQKVLGVIDGL